MTRALGAVMPRAGHTIPRPHGVHGRRSGPAAWLAVALASSLCSARPCASAPLFTAASLAYETGGFSGTDFLATADLNGDGVLDLVTGGDSLFVMLGNGDGSFGDRRGVASLTLGRAVAIGDLNGDGKPDLAVAESYYGVVIVMLGNGDGTFGPPVDYPVIPSARSIALGDANGDGVLDAVVAEYDSSTVSLLLNNGDGTFAPKRDFVTGVHPSSALIADVDGDGVADIVVANSGSASVSILHGAGNGTFPTQVDLDAGTYPYALAVADLNHDGRLDLVTANQASPQPSGPYVSYHATVCVFLANSDGTFAPRTQFATADGAQSLAFGDFDRDGTLDVAVACGTYEFEVGAISLLRGTGTGGFQPSVEIPCGAVALQIAAGDFDRDGAIDLVTVSSRAVSVFLGNGNGTFGTGVAEFATGPFPLSVAIGDVNGDGKPDLVTADRDGTTIYDPWSGIHTLYGLSELMGDGVGGFGARTAITLSADYFANSYTGVKLSDFNGDGTLDAVVESNLVQSPSSGPQSFQGEAWMLIGHGDGTFTVGNSILGEFAGGVTSAITRDRVTVIAGDVNGDHLADLVAVFNNHMETYQSTQDWGEVWVLLNHGDGTFAAADSSSLVFSRNQYSVPLKNEPLFATLGDFNGDGKQDLVVVDTPAGTASVLPGIGNGTFGPAMTFAVDTGAGPLVLQYAMAVSDLNRDGKQDLVAGHQVFLGNGDGTFTPGPDLGAEPSALSVGDVDGDGIPDVAMVDGALGMVAIQLGRGDGTFRKKVIYGVAANSLTMGDVNRDGRLDLVTANSPANEVSVLLSTLPSLAAAQPSAPVALRLLAPRPNPSRARVQIEFQLPRWEPVDVQIFDVAGRRTRTLFAGQLLGPGDHVASWDGRDAAGGSASPGLYLVRVDAGGERRLARIVRMSH